VNEAATLAILLIVPEGIEIRPIITPKLATLLLIVPEGIEMPKVNSYGCTIVCLLIVPEGIEIIITYTAITRIITF